jgi:hypothetical protein
MMENRESWRIENAGNRTDLRGSNRRLKTTAKRRAPCVANVERYTVDQLRLEEFRDFSSHRTEVKVMQICGSKV